MSAVLKVWTHKTRFKGQAFFGNYEFTKSGKRSLKFTNVKTGRETKAYTSHEAAKKDGWAKA